MEINIGVNQIADRFSALASPQRITIVRLLLAACKLGGMTVGALQRELQMPGSTLNHHLERLRLAGIVECRRDRQWIWCAVNAEALREMQQFLYEQCCSRTESAEPVKRGEAVPVAAPGLARAGGSKSSQGGLMKAEVEIKSAVKRAYAEVAKGERCCTSDLTQLRCDGGGYSAEQIAALPPGAELGLGCGNPTRAVPLEPGMTVLDLGSGAGVDAFLAARAVGPTGHVIGVDMTEEMIQKARENAAAGGYANVEFRLGDIEDIPVESGTVDVIISNCVINLAPDKGKVFAEALRALRPGGRMQISDMVTRGEAPEEIRRSVAQWTGCIAGAMDRDAYLDLIHRAGFSRVDVVDEYAYDAVKTDSFAALSVTVVAVK